jgi:hypothetical protein
MDTFTADPHLTWALCCIVIAMLVALLLLADATTAHHREVKSATRRGKRGGKGKTSHDRE